MYEKNKMPTLEFTRFGAHFFLPENICIVKRGCKGEDEGEGEGEGETSYHDLDFVRVSMIY